MSRRVTYHPLFERDVIEAAQWYDARVEGLGDAFVANVAQAVDAVFISPQRFGKLSSELCYSRVQRFPYLILFDYNDDDLQILGVLHTARSIEKWRQSR
jgi:toxin ParE1/3/4